MSKGRETKRKERRERAQRIAIENNKQKRETSVSYTHLTLPTIYSV